MKTVVVFHPAFLAHEQHPFHPERRERLSYTIDQLTEEGVFDDPGVVPGPCDSCDYQGPHSRPPPPLP
ncbi:MAG: hypothetical protein NT074_08975 [Methanomicrobiales archaeon]|nr:hypothetical protein [Methanomicrobiales archaeon]